MKTQLTETERYLRRQDWNHFCFAIMALAFTGLMIWWLIAIAMSLAY